MDTTVTETLRPSLTVSDPDVQLTVLSGATGPAGPAGPNTITSSTSSDGTINLSVNSLTTGTVSATGNISTTNGNISITSGNIAVTSGGISTQSGNISTGNGNISTSAGNVSVGTGNVSVTDGDVTAPDILASADLGYSSGGAVSQDPTSPPTLPITTGVTLNAPSGVITCVNHTYPAQRPAVDAAPTDPAINFTLTNTAIGLNDVVVVSLQDGHDSLSASVTKTIVGSCDISIRNGGISNVTATVIVNFAIIKVATS